MLSWILFIGTINKDINKDKYFSLKKHNFIEFIRGLILKMNNRSIIMIKFLFFVALILTVAFFLLIKMHEFI